jgi:hypothetical protein
MKESKTHCLIDYKNRHNLESIGVITRANGQITQVFKCSQCHKCILENLEEITRVHQ